MSYSLQSCCNALFGTGIKGPLYYNLTSYRNNSECCIIIAICLIFSMYLLIASMLLAEEMHMKNIDGELLVIIVAVSSTHIGTVCWQ